MTKVKRNRTKSTMRAPGAAARAIVGFRVAPALRTALEDAARAKGRSLSQEAESRLEASFARGALLDDALELAYGKRLAGLLMLLGEAMGAVGSTVAFVMDRTPKALAAWADEPAAFNEALDCAIAILEGKKVPGADAPPIAGIPVKGLGKGMGAQFLARK